MDLGRKTNGVGGRDVKRLPQTSRHGKPAPHYTHTHTHTTHCRQEESEARSGFGLHLPFVRPRPGAEQVNAGLSRVGAGWGQGHFPGVRAWSPEPSRWRPWHGPCGRQVSGWPVSFPREPPGGSRYWPLLRLKGVQLTGSKSSSLQRPRRTLKLLTTQG